MNQIHEDSNIGLTMDGKMVALLKWMGWRDIEHHHPRAEFMEDDPPAFWRGHAPNETIWQQLPPLTLDLMAEAEARLGSGVLRHDYYEVNLKEVTGYGCMSIHHQNTEKIVSATKEQRLEALLKTIHAVKD